MFTVSGLKGVIAHLRKQLKISFDTLVALLMRTLRYMREEMDDDGGAVHLSGMCRQVAPSSGTGQGAWRSSPGALLPHSLRSFSRMAPPDVNGSHACWDF